MKIAAIVIAWSLLLVGLANHALAGDWWELALLAACGIGFLGVVAARRTVSRR